MDRDEVEVHKLAKKERGQLSSHLDRTNLVNRGFIIWLLGKIFLWDTAGSPERARWLMGRANFGRIKFSPLPFASKMSVTISHATLNELYCS